jgi:hypothetical protein
MEHQVPDTVTKTVYSPPPHKSGLVLFSFFQKRRLSLKAGPDLSLYIESCHDTQDYCYSFPICFLSQICYFQGICLLCVVRVAPNGWCCTKGAEAMAGVTYTAVLFQAET